MLREDDSREQDILERRALILDQEIDNEDNSELMEEAILEILRNDFEWLSWVYRQLSEEGKTSVADNEMIDKVLESENE